VRAFFSLGRLRAAGSFLAWLMGIAERVALEQRRAERRTREVAAAAAEARLEARRPENGPTEGDDHELRRAVAALPEAYRQVVLLRYYADLSCAQVAERLGLPLGTVTKTLSRAYAMLREQLRDEKQPGPARRDRSPQVQR
jgi:RNA polymerase sigma factor (sigma-70 family)